VTRGEREKNHAVQFEQQHPGGGVGRRRRRRKRNKQTKEEGENMERRETANDTYCFRANQGLPPARFSHCGTTWTDQRANIIWRQLGCRRRAFHQDRHDDRPQGLIFCNVVEMTYKEDTSKNTEGGGEEDRT
jgi:hypothetical protein